MARNKMFEPTFQKAFTEAIHKENQTRMKWHLEYGSKLQRKSAVDWDEDPEEDEEEGRGKTAGKDLPKDLQSLQEVQSRGGQDSETAQDFKDLAWPPQSATGTNTLTRVAKMPKVMRPVPVPTRGILYKGISHDGQGRAGYLKDRTKNAPEEKYYFPICSSWEYGWTYGQTGQLACPDHGRCNIVAQSFYRPNDVQLKPRD